MDNAAFHKRADIQPAILEQTHFRIFTSVIRPI